MELRIQDWQKVPLLLSPQILISHCKDMNTIHTHTNTHNHTESYPYCHDAVICEKTNLYDNVWEMLGSGTHFIIVGVVLWFSGNNI